MKNVTKQFQKVKKMSRPCGRGYVFELFNGTKIKKIEILPYATSSKKVLKYGRSSTAGRPGVHRMVYRLKRISLLPVKSLY